MHLLEAAKPYFGRGNQVYKGIAYPSSYLLSLLFSSCLTLLQVCEVLPCVT